MQTSTLVMQTSTLARRLGASFPDEVVWVGYRRARQLLMLGPRDRRGWALHR